MSTLIFEKSSPGRVAQAQIADLNSAEHEIIADLPEQQLRKNKLLFPEVSEMQVVRHYTLLSQKNYSIDSHFYPLGSCTMKYNPRGVHRAVTASRFQQLHPLAPTEYCQGLLQCLYELQQYLQIITGLSAVSLTPMAGSQGEFAGVAIIRAYHLDQGNDARTEIIVPHAAHGTNPASAVMCGYRVREIPTVANGDIDIEQLKKVVGPQTAGIMLTNPSTLGIFARRIVEVAAIIHQAGGLLYYDGANLNAILGKVKPGDMGFDVVHLNLHKTFATPHGGGGPGAGPIVVSERLQAYLPIPRVAKEGKNYVYVTEQQCPKTIGRLSAFMGNTAVLLRAYCYIRLLGVKGLPRVAEFATLNANYLMILLKKAGFELAYPKRRASHEFIISFQQEKKKYGVSAQDFAKAILDYGYHAPTTYFPLSVPECFLIEPTETEEKAELDGFYAALVAIRKQAESDPKRLLGAPYHTAVRRVDEVQAARQLDLVWRSSTEKD